MSMEPIESRPSAHHCPPCGQVVWCNRAATPDLEPCPYLVEKFADLRRDEFGAIVISHAEPVDDQSITPGGL
jgi:hypothetical protein